MPNIQVLDQNTVNKIAAGEVIERPASVVKELLENAIDARATAITVEIRDGGISFIRVTDNGCGIPREELPLAFLRHSTSKIRSVEDLMLVSSLGFRGEALSSIAAVAQVEVITRTPDSLTGTRYQIEGGVEKGVEEIGAPEGTTFIARNLFYNTPVRRKFLKTAMTEGSHVGDLVEKIALSHPEISIRFIQNNQNKLYTSGNHNLKDIIYTVYGREITAQLLPVQKQHEMITVGGFIGKPVIARSNRNFENYFINGRYIKSNIIYKAIEEAYRPFMMQHKYPFTMLQLTIEPEFLDVNVHPTKMELRFQDGETVFRIVRDALTEVLMGRELIPEVVWNEKQTRGEERGEPKDGLRGGGLPGELRGGLHGESQGELHGGTQGEKKSKRIPLPEPFEKRRMERMKVTYDPVSELDGWIGDGAGGYGASDKKGGSGPSAWANTVQNGSQVPVQNKSEAQTSVQNESEAPVQNGSEVQTARESDIPVGNGSKVPVPSGSETQVAVQNGSEAYLQSGSEAPHQMDLFEERLLSPASRNRHRLIGQLFDTYWLVEFKDQLYIIDQHAAHEKVLYEETMATLKTRQQTSQMVDPPIILFLGSREQELLRTHEKVFRDIGFEIEPFGGREYAVRGVPDNLFSIARKELLMEMLDELAEDPTLSNASMIYEKVASMSCKAAVKGNHSMSAAEADRLIDRLLGLENPYTCPHGRPTIVSMSRTELEKKFKRIV